MKTRFDLILLAILMLFPSMAAAQYVDAEDAVEGIYKYLWYEDSEEGDNFEGKVITVDGTGRKLKYKKLKNRRTLTGEMCAINKIVNTVDVGSGQKNLHYMLDDDLDNYSEFISTISAGVGYDPLVSVIDQSCYYARGTEAGFCIVAGGGSTVLSLDLLNALSITFYCDGNLVGTVAIKDGQTAGVLDLGLIKIPGSDQSVINLTAIAPETFNEIALDFDGVTVGVGQLYRIKYAFVGKPVEFTITENEKNGSVGPASGGSTATPFQRYDPANANVDLAEAGGYNTTAGIIWVPIKEGAKNMTDADLTNTMVIFPLIAIGELGRASFLMTDKVDPDREIYKAGTEVGFKYQFAGLLDLKVGSFIRIHLLDRNGEAKKKIDLDAQVLNLGVGTGGEAISSVVADVDFSGAIIEFCTVLSVDLSGIGVYYAFVREQPEIRHHCPINPSADAYLCLEQTTYQLHANPALNVTWELTSCPEGSGATVTPEGRVTGLDIKGVYVFTVTAEDGCSDKTTLFYDMFPEDIDYGNPMLNDDDLDNGTYVLSDTHNGESSGGLLIIDKLTNPENVIKGTDDYAVYNGGLKLADNNLIIGVKRTDGLIMSYKNERENNPETSDPIGKRLGFVVSSSVVGLNAGVLHLWNIRCFRNGKEVYRHVVDESNAVSAGLAGSSSNNRMRYSITVPWLDKDLNGMEIDEIQLWSSGVLDLGGSDLNIYYAFVEDASSGSADPLYCSATLLSSVDTHTRIDYAALGNPSLVKAVGAMNNISYFVDDSLDTALEDVHTAGVAARTTIPVLLGRTLDFRHELGIVMYNNTYLAGVDLGKGLTVYTMYRGEKTGDTFSDWGVLGADVAGFGDKNIFYIHPTTLYDEVVIDYGQAAEVAANTQYFGLFVRSDADNDGVPDCQDPCSCSSTLESLNVDDVCEGYDLTISGQGIPSNDYVLVFTDPAASEEPVIIKTEPFSKVNLSYTYTTQTPGIYHLTIREFGSDKILGTAAYEVHPLKTEWKTDAENSNWKDRANWTAGTPYCCTDVVIPSGASRYPVLRDNNPHGDEFCCNRILIRPGGSVEGVNKLNYRRAWVQMELTPNCYNLLSAPLKGMVTGDMFVPENDHGVHNPELFATREDDKLDDTNTPENRFNPSVYQRKWYSTAPEHRWNGQDDLLTKLEGIDNMNMTKWSSNFNHVSTPYSATEGFSMWVDNGKLSEDTQFVFTFPKENVTYNYFSDFDYTPVKGSEQTIKRAAADMGRFIYETDEPSRTMNYEEVERRLYDLNEGIKTTISPDGLAAGETTSYFLLGNPFMSHIDARKLILENADMIKGVMWYDGNVTSSLVYDQASGAFVNTGANESIAPMTSAFVIANAPYSSMELTLTAEMILPDEEPESAEENEAKMMRISAVMGNLESSMVVLPDAEIVNESLFDSEVAPSLALFAQVDGTACDIIPAAAEIPLTLICDPAKSVSLRFDCPEGIAANWQLVDKATGAEYSIESDVTLPGGTSTSSGRFVLRDMSAGVDNVASIDASDVFLEVDNHTVTARSNTDSIEAIEVYTVAGIKTASARSAATNCLSAAVDQGVCIVKVTANGKTTAHRLLVK